LQNNLNFFLCLPKKFFLSKLGQRVKWN